MGTFATDTDDILFACVSEENALLSHPADTTFYCESTDDANIVYETKRTYSAFHSLA